MFTMCFTCFETNNNTQFVHHFSQLLDLRLDLSNPPTQDASLVTTRMTKMTVLKGDQGIPIPKPPIFSDELQHII